MPEIIITKADLPGGASGNGSLRIQASVPDPGAPLSPTEADPFRVSVDLQGGAAFAIGGPQSVKLGLQARTNARLTPIWNVESEENRRLLSTLGVGERVSAPKDRMLLLFRIEGGLDGQAAGGVTQGVLSANVTLGAGMNAGYAMLRSAPATMPVEALVREFFGALRMPAEIPLPIAADQVIVFEYGGYLNFKAGVSLGYSLSGASSPSIGDLALTQKYDFSLLARLSLGAKLVGKFRVIVCAGGEPGWGRVRIQKARTRSASVGAAIDASANLGTDGWPASADELLGSILGLKAKNWLQLFEQLASLKNFSDVEARLDSLAKAFVARYTGRAFAELRNLDRLNEFLARVHKATEAYKNLGNHAVTLFDRYYDPMKKTVDARLTAALRKLKEGANWGAIKLQAQGDLGGILWEALQQLTDGDPFGWMTAAAGAPGPSLDTLRQRAADALDLIENSAHEELRQLIGLAKAEFPLDAFLGTLDSVTDLASLQARSNEKLTGFVERILGKTLSALPADKANQEVQRFHDTMRRVSGFRDTTYRKISEAMRQSFQFKLQAEYSRAAEDEALFDFEFDLNRAEGRQLFRDAAHGDFEKVLASFDREYVVVRKGAILNRVTRESRFSMNIIGWNRNGLYEGLDRLIVSADQRIDSDPSGALTAITTLDLNVDHKRRRQDERIFTNLLLRFIGESQGKLEFDPANRMYLIDAIQRMSARYQLILGDSDAQPAELKNYLAFAVELGLADSSQAAFERLTPLLPTDSHGNFGRISLSYDVRFSETSLRALFTPAFYQGAAFKPEVEAMLRRAMRLIVLANYARPGLAQLEGIGWAYWTPGVYQLWKQDGPNFARRLGAREFSPIQPTPAGHLKAPPFVTLRAEQFPTLDTLYKVEDALINGMAKLAALVRQPGKLKPKEFEDALGDFGAALSAFDRFDAGENTLFALLDRLVKLAGGEGRDSCLTLTAKLGDKEVTETLLA